MLKKPKVGQVVVTKESYCCGSNFPEGTIGIITKISHQPLTKFYSIVVTSKSEFWWHCTRCLRRPKKGETK